MAPLTPDWVHLQHCTNTGIATTDTTADAATTTTDTAATTATTTNSSKLFSMTPWTSPAGASSILREPCVLMAY